MPDERAQEALDHLQTAALELIAAFRAVLDVAEEAVREPQGLFDLVSATARAATRAAAHTGGASSGPAHPGGASSGPVPTRQDASGGSTHHREGQSAGVEHIRIS